jgi:hypothetical protein
VCEADLRPCLSTVGSIIVCVKLEETGHKHIKKLARYGRLLTSRGYSGWRRLKN